MEDILASLESQQADTTGYIDQFVPQSDDERKLAGTVMRNIAKAMPRVSAQRQEQSIAEDAYNGHQWDELDRMRLEQLRRPTIVFNEIKPTINAISGIERLNRADIRFVARPVKSSVQQDMAGDLASESYHTALDLCDGEMEFSRAARDMSIGGLGWYGFRMDYDLEPDGKLIKERYPWKEMIWDTAAIKENLADTRWRARKRDIPKEEFEARWPDKVEMVEMGDPQYEETNVSKYELVTPYYSLENEKANPQVGNQAPIRNTIPVIQYQWAESVAVYRFTDSSTQDGIQELRDDEWVRLRRRLALMGVPEPIVVRQMRTIYQQCWVSRGVLVEGPDEIPGGFGIKCITGEWDDNKKVWYGIVRPLLDPQRTMNKSMSTALSMFLTNAKGGVMFETGAFADPILAKEQWSKADAWIEMLEGGAEKVVQREGLKMDQSPLNLFFSESKAAMNYVSGIPQDMLGAASDEANAPTIMKKTQAALAVLGWYFDNITRARKEAARTGLEYIREFWTQGQLLQVGGMGNQKAIPLLKSNLPMQYDLMLDESVRHNPNLKAQIWQDIQPMIPSMLKFGLGTFLLQILKYSPLPAQLVSDMQKQAEQMMKQQQGQPSGGGKGRGKQDDPEKVKAQVESLRANAALAMAKAQQIEEESKYKVADLAISTYVQAEELRQKDELQKHRQMSDLIKGARMLMGGGGANSVGDSASSSSSSGDSASSSESTES